MFLKNQSLSRNFGCPKNPVRKEFFDRCYYGALTRLNGRLYGCAIAAGSDGAGAAAQMQRICRGWRLKPVADPRLGS